MLTQTKTDHPWHVTAWIADYVEVVCSYTILLVLAHLAPDSNGLVVGWSRCEASDFCAFANTPDITPTLSAAGTGLLSPLSSSSSSSTSSNSSPPLPALPSELGIGPTIDK